MKITIFPSLSPPTPLVLQSGLNKGTSCTVKFISDTQNQSPQVVLMPQYNPFALVRSFFYSHLRIYQICSSVFLPSHRRDLCNFIRKFRWNFKHSVNSCRQMMSSFVLQASKIEYKLERYTNIYYTIFYLEIYTSAFFTLFYQNLMCTLIIILRWKK